VTNAQEDSSIKAPIPNTFSSSSNYTSIAVVAIAIVLGFNDSKHIIKSGITILASYFDANSSYIPSSHQTFHNAKNLEAWM
jgi:hypothetical protein